MNEQSIAVVGGGAAGIFASLAAAEAGARVVLYERNDAVGIKIRISGGGKCNITHDADPAEMEEGFIRREARFLRYAFNELTSADVLAKLHDQGVETYTRPNGRVFPVSGKSKDVLAAFERMLRASGVEVRTRSLVERVETANGRAAAVVVNGRRYEHAAIIVTTGGESYRKVGTTGDGIRWAEQLGHRIVPVRPALAPMHFSVPPPAGWQGVALRDVILRAEFDAGNVYPSREGYPTEWRDDLLLTHNGVSGPTVLEVSRSAAIARELGATVHLVVDILPDMKEEELLHLWQKRVGSIPKSEVQSFVAGYLPSRLVPYFLKSAGVDAGMKVSNVSREQRNTLLRTFKAWELGRLGHVPIDRGEVTAGGVALDQVSSTTMESKVVPGLYFAGEALDVSGRVGGYNLQAAFSTGYVAGRAAAGR